MGNFFADNYRACWKYFCESRWYVVFALGVFVFFFLVGFAFPIFFRAEIFSFIADMVKSMEGKSIFELVVYIFLNNLKASFVAMVFGVVLGIAPFLVAVVNGYLLGFVARETAGVAGIGVLWRLAPHGIFELPAVLFSIGIGMKIGACIFRRDIKKTRLYVKGKWYLVVFSIFRKDAGERLGYNLKEGLRFFVFVCLPLLLVAGVIEGVLVGVVG